MKWERLRHADKLLLCATCGDTGQYPDMVRSFHGGSVRSRDKGLWYDAWLLFWDHESQRWWWGWATPRWKVLGFVHPRPPAPRLSAIPSLLILITLENFPLTMAYASLFTLIWNYISIFKTPVVQSIHLVLDSWCMDCALQCGNRRLTIEQTTSIYTVGNVQRFVEEHPLENNSNPSSILFTF